MNYFDTISDDFDCRQNPLDISSRMEWFKRQIASYLPKGSRVLDVGSGLGNFTKLSLESNLETVSLDIAFRLLRRSKVPLAVNGSALQLPFKDNTFDAVISSECIEHTYTPLTALAEMLRVVKKKGIVILSCPNRVWKWSVAIARALRLRRFDGIENWPSRAQILLMVRGTNASILSSAGLFILPFQVKPLWPLIRFCNRNAQFLRAVMINQCWVIQRE